MKHLAAVGLLSVAVFVLPARADTSVVFNEIMYHPATNEALMEWVELYNQLAVDVDMSGWSLDGDIQFRFGTNTVLQGGTFLVVAASPTNLAAATGLTNILGPFAGRLTNGPAQLRLRNNSGRMVNEVEYDVSGSWPVAPNGAGVSLAKLDHSTASDLPSYWGVSAERGGTPGRENFPTKPTVVPLVFNEVSATTNADFWVELMNYGTNTLSVGGYVVARDGVTNGQYTLAAGTMLTAGSFLTLTNSVLGFQPVSGDRLYLMAPEETNVLDAVVVQNGPRGRAPDGTGPWLNPTTLTPGASNHLVFHDEIVINEIMYHHQLLPATNILTPGPSSGEAWLELYNRSTNLVDLTGWTLGGGIRYGFPAGKVMAPHAYLVVANDAAGLRLSYPSIDVLGNYSGKLSHNGDTIILQDAAGNPVNSVTYFPDGRWAHYAAGRGSSLELMDPLADNSKPGAWAASDESAKSSWQTYSYQGVAETVIGPDFWNDLTLSLVSDGECLIDDISVIESPTNNPVEFIANGNFENGTSGWRLLGNHIQSRVEVDPVNPANHVLHLISTGPSEHHMLNHIETTFANGHEVTNGNLYQISFRAKWVAGNNLLNTRLYFNRVAQTTVLPVPALNGTPGAPNSRYAANIGPTFGQFQHRPVVPPANQPVTVSVVAQDPQGVSACEVWWSANGGAFSSAAMTAHAGGLYTGTIPGFAAGTIVQFYVRAVDGLGAITTYPAAGPNSGALYRVADGQADLNLGHNLRLMLTPQNWALLVADTNLMSSALLPCTLIYDEQRPYYDIGVRLKGSMLGRVRDAHHSYHLEFQPDDLFRGVHPVMIIDTSGRPGNPNQQEEILFHHMALHAGGMPDVQEDICTVIPPYYTNTCQGVLEPRYEDEFISTAYPKGDNGNLWLYELVYYPTTTNSFGYKLPSPCLLWGTDITDLGTNKEMYRYDFVLKNHHAADDYSRLIPFCQTLNLPNTPILDAQSRLVMDVDEWLRLFTMISLVGEGDWYTFGPWPHNPQLYLRPDNNKMTIFPWDVEQLFQRSVAAPLVGDNMWDWAMVESPTNSAGIGFPDNTRRIYAHALDIIATTFNTNYMTYWADHYASFCPGQDYSDMLSWIPQRTEAVLNEIDGAGGNTPFSVSGTNFIVASSNLVTLSGTAPVQVQKLLINGVEYAITWTSVSQWAVSIPVSSPTNTLQLTAFDLNGNPLTNYTSTLTVVFPGPAPAPAGEVVINEIMYNPPLAGAAYLELLNASSNTAFDLSGWSVVGLNYTFPPGTVLAGGELLVLAQDQSAFINAYGPATVPFDIFPGNLSGNGETLTLQMPGAQTNQALVVDKVRYATATPWPATTPGVSLQLIDPVQDNTRVGNWAAAPGTPAADNSVRSTLPPFPPLWLNEVEADNTSGITNRAGLHVPWLELYNPSTNTVFLTNLYLATTYTNLPGWAFPTGAVIHPGQFEVIFADGQTNLSTSDELHTSFSLSSAKGSLALSRLYDGQPQVLDYLDYANLATNHSYGSFPDGQCFARREFFHPTPGGTNDGSTGGSFIPYAVAGSTYTQDFNSLPNPGPISVNTTNPVTINGITYSLPDPFDFAAPAVASGFSGGLGLPALAGWYGLADPAAKVGTRFGATYGDQTTGGQISFGPPSSGNRALGLLATSSTGYTAFGARFVNQSTNILNRIDLLFTAEIWRQSDKPKSLQFCYLIDPTASSFISTNATAYLPALNVTFPTVLADVGGVPVDGTLPANQTNLSVLNQVIADWPPGAALWLVWEMLDPAGKAQGLAIDNLSFTAWTFQPNTVPVLNPIPTKFIYAGQTLQFTATATDADLPPQTLRFTLDPGAPANASISASGLFTWTANNVPVPSTNGITIRVTDNGTPNLSSTTTFQVVVLPLPWLGVARPAGSNFPLSFGTLTGQTYQVQYKTNLTDSTWTPLISPVPGTGGILEVSDPMLGSAQRFYRLLVLP